MKANNNAQQEIGDRIEKNLSVSSWEDWKWQLKHSIRSIEKFEHLTGIRFDNDRKRELERTFEKFPLSIAPYYLSLIDKQNYLNDPVFKQAFGGVEELTTL